MCVAVPLALAALTAGPPARAQSVKEASAPAPQLAKDPNAPVAMDTAEHLPNAEAFHNNKQQKLREHHREIPLGDLPAGFTPEAAPMVSATPVAPSFITAPNATSPVKIYKNQSMAGVVTAQTLSSVGEPSVASRGNEVLFTGNWYSAFSKNGGTNFSYVNPYTSFPATGAGFCCDQVALYAKSHDLMIWLLQYSADATGNILRVAVATGNDIPAQNWRYYDFSPKSVGNWSGEWFDYPDLSLSSKYLYVSSNAFGVNNGPFKRAMMLRLPLDKLKAYAALNYNYYNTTTYGGLRGVQGATGTMYFAAHKNVSTLTVFSWPESSTTVTPKDVTVQTWDRTTCIAPGPDGRDFLGFADSRITAAWLGKGNVLGFGWTAPQNATYHFPQARIALIDAGTMAVVAQPLLRNESFAFAYPAAAPNSDGDVGLAVSYGGGAIFPSHAVGILRKNGAAYQWNLVQTAAGQSGPSLNRWGDYQAVRPIGNDGKNWVATGYTMTGPDRTNTVPRFVRFGPQ